MIVIQDSADMADVLSRPIDLNLKTILQERLALLAEYLVDWNLGDLAIFIIVERGDGIEAIERELGISPFCDPLGESCYPEPIDPAWEFCIARQGWFDFTFALSDSGLGHCLLVPDCDGVDPMLLELCRAYATT